MIRLRLSLLLAVTALWAGLTAEAAAQGSAATDRAVLEALYDMTGGPGWTDSTNWKTAAPLGEWHGVATGPAGRVTGVWLPGNGLAGPIPPELGRLTNLSELNLGDNGVMGPVPRELGSLSNLELLELGSNDLTGPVPAWLGNLTGLRGLHLGSNDLTGPIPRGLGGLSNLESLSLWGNALSGAIPAELGRLTALRLVELAENDLRTCARIDSDFRYAGSMV